VAVNLNGIDLSGAAASSARKAPAAQSAPTSSQDATQQPQSAQVSITSTASLLANLQQALSASPAVDAKRIDSISKALSAGTYSVNPDKIANGLLQTERALGRLQSAEK
jgi:negative regulator of flagellin synthesis FlgM